MHAGTGTGTGTGTAIIVLPLILGPTCYAVRERSVFQPVRKQDGAQDDRRQMATCLQMVAGGMGGCLIASAVHLATAVSCSGMHCNTAAAFAAR